ncbi:IDEAL domain-containing protein [Bacillus salacetis]|uniref:IDEAL domain-containing protein n=1 Tax=Bacillus salacetis TaxID=2315464 RepID=UPI003BA084BB
MNYEIGEWVKAKTVEGELVIGYIEAVNQDSKSVKIRAVQSEQESMTGRTIETLLRRISALPSSSMTTKNEIMQLIDLALFTRDEDWFKQLTADLNRVAKKSGKERAAGSASSQNRLNFPHVI